MQNLIKNASFVSSRVAVDSDFLPFSYDFQDLPSPGPPQPFELNDGLPHVAFVSAAESLYCESFDDRTIKSPGDDEDDERATEKKSFKSKFNPHELIRKEQSA